MFKNLSSVWWEGVRLPKYLLLIITAGLFISCDNFLSGLDSKNELEDGISYANARSIGVLVNAAEGTGTTVPSGHYTAKSGYPFEVTFTESADYAFAGWKAVFESDGTEATEGIHFDNPAALKTNVIISTEGIKVVPQCIRRIYIDGEPLPKYEATGVSRDRSITVNFSEPPAADSFLFTDGEIPAGATPVADEEGLIWAYKLNGLTYFKNIEITGADEISLADHFKKPEVDGNLLTVAVDKSNPIEIDTGSSFKIIKVTISDKIKASNGITINSGKTWRYQVTNETDEKATVTLSSEVAEGSVYLAGTRDYSIGQKLTLAFTESADYQFIRWDYDSSVVYVAEPLSASTTAVIMEKSTGTQIKAVCAPRLRVLSFTPQNDVLTPTVSKNSSIVITFSQNLPSDEGMLNNISIAVGGSPVKNSFSSPRVNGNIITFSADKTNMLDVYAGQTKTVTVTVPADFYYQTEEGYKVTYGGNGISFDYKIDNSTIEKAEIIFSSVQGSGTITPESGNVKHYSIGEEVAISFLASDGWQFNGWKVTGADESVLSKIKIADENLPSTKLTILEAVTGVTVSADVSECLRVISKSPSAESNYKDSDIVLTFNKSLDSECSSMLNKIRISWDGNSLDGCYTDRILSADGKTITVKSTAVLSVPKNSEKTISVIIPSDFFYKNSNGLKIYHEEESFSFKVNHTTKEKAKITYSVINGETETAFSPAGAAGTINRNSYEEYNLGEEVDLSFDLNPGYQFYGWKIVDSDGNAVTTSVISFKNSKNTDLNPVLSFNKACSGITIYAVCYLRPAVLTESLQPYSTNSLSEFPKNSPIIIHFNHKIVNGKDDIVVNYTGPDFTNKSEYFTTVLSSDGQTITLTPKKILKLNNSYETVTVKLPHDALYYLASDNKTKITIGDEDFIWKYRVNNTTVKKTVLRINTADANGNYILVNAAPLSTGSTQNVNIEQTVELEYPMEEGYKFLGWQIESASSGITVSPSGYVTSGSITVGPSSDPSFVLEIDDDNPLKARITSYKSVSVGSNGWGISVSAKDTPLPFVSSIKLDNATDIFSVVNTIFDSKVYINFSKPISTSTSFSSSGAISIVKAGTNAHYESYFTASWSSDRKQLVLTPKETLKQFVPQSDDILSLTIKLNANEKTILDTDGYALIATKNINNSFNVPYTITGTRETTKPVFNSFTLYKPQYTNGVEESGSYTSLNASARSYIAPATATNPSYSSYVSTNHVNKKLFFDMSASDSQSGIKNLTIKETFLRYSGEYNDLQTPIISPTETYSIATATKRAYTLKSEGDGLVQLDFIIEDYAGNSTIKTYFVHKDSTFDPSSIIPGPSFTGQSNYRIPQGTTGPVATYDGESGTNGSSSLYSYYTDTQSQVFNNQVVFDLSNSFIKDIYYSSGSASKLSTIYADVKWGYSENSITNTMNYDSAKKWYVLTDAERSDLTKDVYVQFTVRDEVGNTGSLIRCLPGHAALLNPVIYDATPSGKIYKYWQIKDLIASGYADRNSKISSIGATRVDYMLLYRYKENSSSSWSEYRYNYSRFYTGDWVDRKFAFSDYTASPKFKPLTYRPYGIYEIRLLPYYQYGERVYWGSVSAQTLTVNYTNSTTGPTVVYSGSSSTATVPSSLYVSISEKPKNTGYHKLYAYSSSFTRTSGYTYYIWYKKTDETNYNYTEFTSNSGFYFTVPSGYTYDFGVYAVNTATGQSNITTAKKTLACTYDNVPPAFADSSSSAGATDMFKRIYSSDGFSLKTIKPKDTGVGLYTNAQGEVCLDYYVIKNDAPFNTSGVAPLAITLEDITSANSPYADYKKTIYYKENDTSVFIPYGPLDEGVYTVCLYMKDKNLNDAVYNFTVHNRLYSNYKTPTIEVVTASTSTSLTNPFTALRVSTATQFGFSSLNMTTKKWAGISSVNGNTGNGSSTYETFKHSSSATSCENMNPNSYFYKTDGTGGSYGWGAYMNFETFYKFIGTDNTAHNKYYYPVYIYPDYYGRKGTSTELVCSNKNLLDGAGVYQVFYDNPMFVHTLCYPTNLGKEAGLWEAKGTELSIETRKDVISTNSSNTPKTFTYIPDVSSIPAGWYYVAVAHFADGTTVVTTPVMK